VAYPAAVGMRETSSRVVNDNLRCGGWCWYGASSCDISLERPVMGRQGRFQLLARA